MRIHPDGNNPGTLGCVGVYGTEKNLTNIRGKIKEAIKAMPKKKVPCSISVENNPNNHKPPGSKAKKTKE